MKEITTKQNYIYNGAIINVRCDDIVQEDGRKAKREVVEHRGGVCIVPIDNEGNVLLVKQFRYAIGKYILEIPAGKREVDEDPFETAKRELSEETGCTAGDWKNLGSFVVTPGYCTEKFYIYLARELQYFEQHLDEGEHVSIEKIRFEDALDMV
ncbi:MAG: NUDIX hydrolase [Clostridia bacterium]|nr:NUDIX hydrolase [Clostridia bacterium]